MRFVILALALIVGLGNSDEKIDQLLSEQKYEEAFAEAKRSAEQGDANAHDLLGWMYETGNGTEADNALAEKHYRIAVAKGESHAGWRLGVMIDMGTIKGAPEEAVALFETAAAKGFSDAIVSLAVMQATGRGTRQDYAASLANYRRAATMGDSGGVRGIGIMYYYGEGVPNDPMEAAAWFLVAAVMGNESAEESFDQVMMQDPEFTFEAVQARGKEIARELGLSID